MANKVPHLAALLDTSQKKSDLGRSGVSVAIGPGQQMVTSMPLPAAQLSQLELLP